MGEIAPEEQFLPLSTIFCYLMLDFCVKTGIRFSLRDKRLFEITEVEIARVDCIFLKSIQAHKIHLFTSKYPFFNYSAIRNTDQGPLTRSCPNFKSCEFSYDSDTTLSEIFPSAIRQ